MTEEHFTDEEFDELANFAPAFDDEVMEQLESAASNKARGQQRRLCLLACARSADDLSKISVEIPEAFGEMLELVEMFKVHAKGLYEMAESACARMQIADCRGEEAQPTV